MSEEKVSRRGYAKYAAAGIVVVAVAGAGAYYASRPGPASTPTVAPTTKVVTETKVETETAVQKEWTLHNVHYGYHDEGAWEPQIYNSTVEAITKSPYDFKFTFSEGVFSEGADTVMELAAQENDIVYATTNVYDSTVRKVAPRFPEVEFILESDPIGKNPKTVFVIDEYPQNVIILGPGSMTNDYVAGALAARLIGPNGKIGFIQAFDVPSVTHPGAMILAGARSVHPNVEGLRDIIGNFVDPVKTRDAVKFMASQGVGCVFVQQDDTSGLLEASAQGIYAIPSYRDLTGVDPETIVCCSTWNWEPGLSAILNAIAEGRWDDLRNTEWYWEMTLANDGLNFGTFGHMVSDEDKAFVDDMVQKINSGELDLPYLDTWEGL